MSNEWDANIQAIGNIFDRDRAEIARKSEVIEKLSDKLQDREDTIEALQKQLIERLAEINGKDERIAVLEKALRKWVSMFDGRGTRILELEATIKRLHDNYGIPA